MATCITPINQNSIVPKSINSEGLIYLIARVVALYLATTSQNHQHARREIASLEGTLKAHSFESADLMRNRGTLAVVAAVVTIVLSAASFAVPVLTKDKDASTNAQAFIQKLSGTPAELIKPFDFSRDGKIKKEDTLSQIAQIKLQDENSKSQNDGNSKEQMMQVLQAAMQQNSAAAKSN